MKPQQLERLLEVSRILTSTLDLQPLLEEIVKVASDLTESESASILLYDPNIGKLRFEAAPGIQSETLKKVTVPLENSAAGWIYANAKPLVIQDASQDPRVFREVDQVTRFETRSLLGVPLIIKHEPIGVLEAVNKRGAKRYTKADLAILESLGTQAAIAIENARLLSKLQDANAELMRLDHMKSDFIAIASHELRTPLGLILGHATFLKEMVPENFQEQMDVIVRSALRLKEIVEDMSTISHKEQGQSVVRRKSFSMSELIENMVIRFREAAKEKGIQLDADVPEDDPLEVQGDRDKIDIALSNLVRNAITFTDSGGQVGIKAEVADNYIKVFVVDTGIGIPEDDVERIFDRFFQVESHLTRKHGGMGLGLSIAKAMIEIHNGQIWCESKEGVGSLFCFMLPVDEQSAAAAAKVFTV